MEKLKQAGVPKADWNAFKKFCETVTDPNLHDTKILLIMIGAFKAGLSHARTPKEAEPGTLVEVSVGKFNPPYKRRFIAKLNNNFYCMDEDKDPNNDAFFTVRAWPHMRLIKETDQ